MSAFLALALAGLLGSLPTGYLLARKLRGVDIRRVSPHNLGLGTVAAAAGAPTLVVVTALDLIKGALAVGLARWLSGTDWVLSLAGAAAIGGHTASPFVRMGPRVATRMKGTITTLGVLVGLVAWRAIPAAALLVALGVAALALTLPRLTGRRWGYLSVATVLAAWALPVALTVLDAPSPYVFLTLIYGLVTFWNHKEHLLRVADGVEPRVGENLPLPGPQGREAVAAFMIHPMSLDDIVQARRFRWLVPLRRLGLIHVGSVRRLARLVRPMKVDDIYPIVTADGRRARVYLIGVPMMPDQIRSEPALAQRRAVQAADLAASLGATVLGLGAYWSVVGNKGLEVAAHSPITITNGGAYTAGTMKLAVPLVLERLRQRGVDPARATAAVVGANGVVGFGICRSIIEYVGRLIMLGTDQERLARSRDLLRKRSPRTEVDVTTNYDALRGADVIFSATSASRPVIFPEHVRPGCVIFDLGRPPDVHPSVRQVPDVELIPGGVVRLPGDPRGQLDLGYGQGLVPACLAETVILALDGQHDRASLGERTNAENVEYFIERGRAMGFEVLGVSASTPSAGAGVCEEG
ncbi:MAG: glycerol-3-phosphate acyltransferase [Armatimonadota bacterium]|nr:glycerol-3-phosphate acyltransferase [Armatimonadota bacterium]